MTGRLMNGFVKVTAWPVQKAVFRTKIYYEDRRIQSRKVRGPAIIISNHTSVFDYAVFLFVFFGRTLRYQMAEVLFRKKKLGRFLRAMGGIYVDRESSNFGFVAESEHILQKGGVVGIFPESRLPRADEERPLLFKSSAALIALSTGVPVIPVYTAGGYFTKKRARVIIGTPIDVTAFVDSAATERENLKAVSEGMRQKIIQLGKLLDERQR
ncbi:MAG: lysophospholipid acyltransferase family protein [Lachnospiraceae bacterium]